MVYDSESDDSRVNQGQIELSINRRLVVVYFLLFLMLLAAVCFSLGVGAEYVSFGDTVKIVASHLFGSASSPDPTRDLIIWQIRLPRIILGIVVGMLLAAAGSALQGLLRNPLADPYTVGVSSGAALGAAIAMVFGLMDWFFGFGVPAFAFAFAVGSMIVVYSLARSAGRVSIYSFLLAGIVVGSFLWALLTFVLTLAHQDLAVIIRWLLGSLSVSDHPWGYVLMTLPFAVVGITVLIAFARDLNVYSVGEETAVTLGIETEKLKIVIIAAASLITAAAVAASGIIGFVGLIVPHIARRLFGADHRILIPTSSICGAILLVAADTAARVLGEMPIGVITAMLGAPFFLYLLRSRGSKPM